jgi:hypothetical protein
MKQIITGPYGRVAYHGASHACGQYPALNLPCRAFARGDLLVAANSANAPGVIAMPRQLRTGAAMAMFGTPAKR